MTEVVLLNTMVWICYHIPAGKRITITTTKQIRIIKCDPICYL